LVFQVNLFVLLSMISFMLNVTGLILGCQGIQFVSGVPRCDLMDMDENKTCLCCEELHPTTCTEAEAVLKLYHVKSCSAARLLLKVPCTHSNSAAFIVSMLVQQCSAKVIAVFTGKNCVIFLVRSSSWFCNMRFGSRRFFCSWKAILTNLLRVIYCSTPVSDVISLHYIYVTRIRGVEVYCPLDPPPPYETVCSLKSSEQVWATQLYSDYFYFSLSDYSAEEIQEPSSSMSLSPSNASCVPAGVTRRPLDPLQKCSKSDPGLLHCQLPQGTVLNCETETLNDVNPLNAVTLRKSSRARTLRGRPQSLIDYNSYMDTKRRVAWILEQSCSMSPDIHDLVENIKSVLKSDEKHMSEAVTSATFLEQVVMTPAQQATSLTAQVLPSRLHPGLLHLESCGDLSTFTTGGGQLVERRIQRAEHARPHSVIGVVRETVL
ncbi:F1892 protein, partial [Chloropsis hardwickii]|nr:F1892 protein [Chloropsis hardwickii]